MSIDYDKIRLGVALPNIGATFPSQFVDSFFCIATPMRISYLRPSSHGPIDSVRNELADLALAANCTHVWYCDTDQVYPQDVLIRLLSHGLPVVTGKVHLRMPPYSPILRRVVGKDFVEIPDEEWSKGGLVEVDGTGFGCVLLSTEVLKAIEKPWFKFIVDGETKVGEDFYFWAKVKDAGYRIFVDCDVKIGHLTTMSITEESYFAFKYAQAWDRGESSDKAVGAPGPPSQISDVLKQFDKLE